MKSLTKVQLMSLIQQRAGTEIPMSIIEYWYMMYAHDEGGENQEEEPSCQIQENYPKD